MKIICKQFTCHAIGKKAHADKSEAAITCRNDIARSNRSKKSKRQTP